jgi:hypothetical protein
MPVIKVQICPESLQWAIIGSEYFNVGGRFQVVGSRKCYIYSLSRIITYQFYNYLGVTAIFLLILTSSQAQPDASRMFSKYTTKEGLLINSIYDIERSRNGMWWIGTGAGLQRFDGYGFENWTEPVDKKNLKNPGVQRIYEDSAGNVFPPGKRNTNALYLTRQKKSIIPMYTCYR